MKPNRILILALVAVLAALIAPTPAALAQSGGPYELTWTTIDAGGGTVTGGPAYSGGQHHRQAGAGAGSGRRRAVTPPPGNRRGPICPRRCATVELAPEACRSGVGADAARICTLVEGVYHHARYLTDLDSRSRAAEADCPHPQGCPGLPHEPGSTARTGASHGDVPLVEPLSSFLPRDRGRHARCSARGSTSGYSSVPCRDA